MPATLRPDGYIPRIVDAQVERYLRTFGFVEVAGTKWCGKTWTSLAHAASASYVEEALGLAGADPTMMLVGERPHVVDEWQLVPAIWDAARREVDCGGARGSFILTGSSAPVPSKGAGAGPVHSGAGRVGRVRMHPMTLAESGESTGGVSLAGLFAGDFEPQRVERDTQGLLDVACRGGWPQAVGMGPDDAQLLAREYLRATLEESVTRLGLDPDVARRLVGSVARNLGQATTYKTIIADMFGAEEDPLAFMSEDAVRVYLNALKALYLVEEVPGWAPPARSRKRFAAKPKRYLADPSLAVAALGMSPRSLMADWQTFGLVFEGLCMRDLTVYARALELADGTPVRYYRDDSGLEADAIVQLADGRWAAFEFKTSEDKTNAGVRSLARLRSKLTASERSQTPPPAFMAVIVGIGEYAREAQEGIYVIPLRALGA